ncbi:ADP-ribosylglycohydrolase family protein [Muricauda sp. 2012CJ35-5]|uniref:ADP-ribosylglycohydrolase family protein n=1 Tax=Flagellimonas spongiicola TaxID=2942208 RepID=A0ABT0PN74_9FLAO|nr:ADP-ribosylglycohydrolase family protein [Allomuricauda spongiicola]MCL6272813.1 ADP-ribosylglycohydrolase family protein [Allomuricauda spongiicola]
MANPLRCLGWGKHFSKFYLLPLLLFIACKGQTDTSKYANEDVYVISREDYANKLHGFWLGQCIANWTGLVTEMDKIGNIGAIKTGAFYIRDDWGKPDLPNIWSGDKISDISPTIDFVFRDSSDVWGADDDTDIEYMYQHLMAASPNTILTPEEIRNGWLKHIIPEEENYLWVSNQRTYDLMQAGMLPPLTGDPTNNAHFDMIDAQLTTEIFGLFAPSQPAFALKLADLPIQTTARGTAQHISNFYVVMHALAPISTEKASNPKAQLFWMAEEARKVLPDTTYAAHMYDYTKNLYNSGIPWEQTRDSIYVRYQIQQKDGYEITGQNLHCNGCFAAGINFAASLVSLFYGEGDIKETIKIGSLTGWDSDNPTATWGGLLGFMMGKNGVETAFGRTFSNRYNIHRTRQNFPNNGMDTFENMSAVGISIIDRIVEKELGGTVDLEKNIWVIPKTKLN